MSMIERILVTDIARLQSKSERKLDLEVKVHILQFLLNPAIRNISKHELYYVVCTVGIFTGTKYWWLQHE